MVLHRGDVVGNYTDPGKHLTANMMEISLKKIGMLQSKISLKSMILENLYI